VTITDLAVPYVPEYAQLIDPSGGGLVAANTFITSRGTANGGVGTYTVSPAQFIAPGTSLQLVTGNGVGGLYDHNIANNVVIAPVQGPQPPNLTVNRTINFTGVFATDLAGYQALFPNYPALTNQPGYPAARAVGGAGIHSRAAAITAFAPAVGTLFTGSTTNGSNCLVTAQTLSVGEPVNNSVALTITNKVTGVHQDYTVTGTCAGGYTLSSNASATLSGATFATGAENEDGTYNGALFPPDTHAVISWNDGSVFVPSATHTAAQ
jgi:hypothetical protein